MTALTEDKDTYLSAFTRFEQERAGDAAPLRKLRQAAIDRFAAHGFPTPDDEEWRFTPLAALTRVPFAPAAPANVAPADIDRAAFDAGPGSRLVFVNGYFVPYLSSLQALPPGAVVASLAEALTRHFDEVEPHLARHADAEDNPFVALNTAFLRDGAFVSLPRGAAVEGPIHLVFVSAGGGAPAVCHPRNLIVAGAHAQATVVESYVGLGGDVAFTNAVTEIVADEAAALDHYKVQRESRAAFHVATQQVRQGRASNFRSHAVTLGGRLARNDVNAYLGGEGCECTLNGLYLADGERLVDNHTRIDHATPRCASHELYKGVLDGKAHGVFNGKIYVHQDAQKTDAKQTNQTLLLSSDAVINTKPQLEIFADDVKCTHGATVGQLDAEALFYLRSRGIPRDEARALLTFAFANDIVSRINVAPLRDALEARLAGRTEAP